MRSPAQLPSVTHAPSPRARRGLGLILGVFLFFGILFVGAAYLAYPLARDWVQSPAGQNAAGRGLGSAIKVDGQFAPLHLQDWKITTDSFSGPGWPGEAIGRMDAQGIAAEFDPAAVWEGAWRIKYVTIAHASIDLRKPDDALKRPVAPKKPHPWYAFFLPSRVECGPIVSPDAELLYRFQGRLARIEHARVQADLVGRDLKYTATSGTLDMPYLPPLRIQRLEMLVTRPMIRIDTAQLAGLEAGSTTRVNLAGTLGMREDKTIDATGEVVDLPIEQLLPEELRSLVHGRATGRLTWKRDDTGRVLDSDGELSLAGARLDNFSVFRQLALLHGNADLTDFAFDQAELQFHLHGGHVVLDLRARSPGRLTLAGKVDYAFDRKRAEVELDITDLPLRTWLPTEFKPGAEGLAQAHLQWQGDFQTLRDSAGHVTLNLDGGTLAMPAILRRLLAAKKLCAPEVVRFRTARLDLVYGDRTFQLTRADLVLPGILTAQVGGTLGPDSRLQAKLAWHGLRVENWLPPTLAEEFSGDIAGHARFDVQQWRMESGAYAGQVRLTRGELRNTPFQSVLARFVGDPTLLNLPLTRASFGWIWSRGRLEVHDLDLRSGDRLGVTGGFVVAPDQSLSGALSVGTRSDYLDALGSLGPVIFPHRDEGLRWARVRLSGTAKKPRQDLTAQVLTALPHHPFAVLGLGFKAMSWTIGNWFGERQRWELAREKGLTGGERGEN